ncbi:MAG TPA: type II toxin-antitoxin system HicB family antitoxin [Dehalococcoidia bacterium]|nr:type II toxin-antitoxin system HicB family antitoxin [Dehalococcoidia bacterium]
MKTYDLYVHTGPKRRKTYIHVPQLTGCIAQGDTTDAAIEAAPEAIRAFIGFIARYDEPCDPEEPFRTRIAEEDLSGGFLGTGFLPPDAKPLSMRDADALMQRLAHIHDAVRRLTDGLSAKQLDAAPAKGRPIRRILSHLCAEGGYLRGVTGASRIQREVDEGKRDPLEALDALWELEVARLASMPAEERGAIVQRGQSPWSVRASVRRMLEHGWEHYSEIAERLGEPA